MSDEREGPLNRGRPLEGDENRSGYRYLLTSASVSNIGDGVRFAALPLMAQSLTTSPIGVAALVFSSGLPWLLFSLISGVVVDRADRRKLMILVNLVRCSVMVGLALLAAMGLANLVMLCLAAFVLGIGETLFDTAAPAIVRSTVAVDDLERANGYLATAETVGNQLAGPALGGVLFAVAVALPFGLDAATFLIAAVLLLGLKGSFRPAGSRGPSTSVWTDIRKGLSWLRRHRLLRTLALITLVVGIADAAWFAVLVLFVVQLLDLPDAAYGVMVGLGALGGIVAGLLVGRITTRIGQALSLLVALGLAAVAQLAIGLSADAVVVALMLSLSAFALTVWHVVVTSIAQASVPDHLIGRVMSVFRLTSVGGPALGAIIGGVVAEFFGLRAPFLLGVPFLVVAACLGSRVIRRDEIVLAREAVA
jgi:MFS family permease